MSNVQDDEEHVDTQKFEEYLQLLKDIEAEESKQNNTQPRLMNSMDMDSRLNMSDEDKMVRDQEEYAEYMRKL
jgi:hypothetical protein